MLLLQQLPLNCTVVSIRSRPAPRNDITSLSPPFRGGLRQANPDCGARETLFSVEHPSPPLGRLQRLRWRRLPRPL